MQQIERKPLFDLGQLVATPGALAALEKSGQSPMDFLTRHVMGDWGDLCEEDRKENQFSLEKGFRLLSSYKTNAGDVSGNHQHSSRVFCSGNSTRSHLRIKNQSATSVR